MVNLTAPINDHAALNLKLSDELAVAKKELQFQSELNAKLATELGIANIELLLQNKEKTQRAAELVIADMQKSDRSAELVIANIEKAERAAELLIANIERTKRAAELIIASAQALYDELTKLPNRRLLMDRLGQAVSSAKRGGHNQALLFIDLDNFKSLNDSHGHAAGDLLLIEVGKRMKACVRQMDTVARIGGDEFVILIGQLEGDEAQSITQARGVAEKIRLTLAELYRIEILDGGKGLISIAHHCTASIGVAVFSGNAVDAEVILSVADAAMYEAKKAGRNQVRFHHSVI